MKRLIGTQGLAAGTMFTLSTDNIVIGRDGECDIALMDNTVSLRHAALTVGTRGQTQVRDLGSTNGVFVNEQRVEEASLLPGDLLQIGDSVFRYEE